MMSMMPVQNTGRLTPVTAMPMLRRSSHEYWRVADTMPAGTPMTSATRSAPPVRISVALNAREHLGQDLAAQRDRAAEIALHHAAEPARVLHGQGAVEAQLAVQALDVLARGLGAQHDGRRVARRQVHHGEDEQRDPEENGDGEEQPPDDVSLEAAAPYCSHTCVSTRSKFGCSLKPCTRLRWMITCLPWSTKIHGASSTTTFCASR